MIRTREIVCTALALFVCLWIPSLRLAAAIVQTGNVEPSISSWTSGTFGYVGRFSEGGVLVSAGSKLKSSVGNLGFHESATGTATVTGAGSNWTNGGQIYVGRFGNGTLKVEDSGSVSNTDGYLGYELGAIGAATISGLQSKWINRNSLFVGGAGSGSLAVADGGEVQARILYASLNNLHGNGTITVTHGAVLDTDLRFDATHGTLQNLSFGSGGTLSVNWGGKSLGVGYQQNGSLIVEDGVEITSDYGYLGFQRNSNGTATVTGIGTQWTNSDTLFVGQFGKGELSITAGGQVSNTYGYVGFAPDSIGTATVTGTGSKWISSALLRISRSSSSGSLTVADGGEVIAAGLFASLSSLSGDGTITATEGAVLDANLRFDATNGSQAIVPFGSGGIMTVHANGGHLGAGYNETGSLIVTGGANVISKLGYLGYSTGANGKGTVSGPGSQWKSDAILIGDDGNGTLTIEAGANVTSTFGYIGYNAFAIGSAAVTGIGSKWRNNDILTVGYLGKGTLNLRDGGLVDTASLSVNSKSLICIDVRNGTSLTVGEGNGGITNDGTMRLLAGASELSWSQHEPIAAITWNGTGIFQSLGGTWDTTSHIFTVSDTLTGQVGLPIALDVAEHQRVRVDDSSTGWTMGASLLAKTGSPKSIDFTATTLDSIDATGLGDNLLSAWYLEIAGDGYTTGDPLYLSFAVDAGLTLHDIELWHLESGTWNPFSMDDLNISGGYASFTVEVLGSFALAPARALGDFNNDGVINGRDFLDWQRNPNLGDLADWQAAYGTSSTFTANSAAVPEPRTGLLTLLPASLALAVARNRRASQWGSLGLRAA